MRSLISVISATIQALMLVLWSATSWSSPEKSHINVASATIQALTPVIWKYTNAITLEKTPLHVTSAAFPASNRPTYAGMWWRSTDRNPTREQQSQLLQLSSILTSTTLSCCSKVLKKWFINNWLKKICPQGVFGCVLNLQFSNGMSIFIKHILCDAVINFSLGKYIDIDR